MPRILPLSRGAMLDGYLMCVLCDDNLLFHYNLQKCRLATLGEFRRLSAIPVQFYWVERSNVRPVQPVAQTNDLEGMLGGIGLHGLACSSSQSTKIQTDDIAQMTGGGVPH